MSNSTGRLFRVTTFGESHGPALLALVEGVPAGLPVDLAFIDAELRRRQGGYGRGGRQRIESDAATILSGVRLGQGRGYYDRALAALRRRQPVLAIGLAWECQIAPALVAEPWDMPLDMIATPQRLVDCRKSR